MPAYTPIREFVDALKTGETNITRRLKYLVQNYDQIPAPIRAVFEGWVPAAGPAEAIPGAVKDLLKHAGDTGALSNVNKLSQPEIDHIDEWPWQQKATVKAWADAAKNHPEAVIYWELHRDPAVRDFAYYDPNSPMRVTCRTFAGRVNLSPSFGSITYQ